MNTQPKKSNISVDFIQCFSYRCYNTLYFSQASFYPKLHLTFVNCEAFT